MKKKYFALTLSIVVTTLTLPLMACSNNVDNGVKDDVVTGVEISGPIWVNVGSTITLKVDVLGTENDSVNWSTSDTSIASIDDKGVLTGLKEGEVVVSAVSTLDPSFSATYNVSVRGVQADGIELVILSEDDDIIKENDIYKIPGGKEFKIGYKLNNDSASEPTSVSYSFSFADGTTATSNEYTIELLADKTAIVKFNRVFEGGVLTVAARYSSSVNVDMKHSIFVESYDKNVENDAKLAEIVENIKSKEVSSLVSAKREVYKLNTSNEDDSVNAIEEFAIYDGAVYGERSSTSNSTTTIEKTYATIDTSKNSFYLFSYKDDKTIDYIYSNEIYKESLKDTYIENAKLPHFVDSGVPVYGFNSLLNNILFGDTYATGYSLGSFDAKGNATYLFEENTVKINSEFVNESENTIILSFDLKYNDSYELESYEYSYDVKLNGETTITNYYTEKGSNFVYGVKNVDSEKDIDIFMYYIKDFKISYIEDYNSDVVEDDPRYDIISCEKDSDGNDVYSLTYDHSLPLKVDQINPTTGSTLIDVATVEVVTDGVDTKNHNFQEDGTIVIGAPKNDDGDFFACTSTLTFKTRGGGSDKITIKWIKPNLTGIKFSYSDTAAMPSDATTFPSIRTYQNTEYFWLNPIPDDSIYSFGLKIVDGIEDGIKLSKYESGDNLDHAPKGSYAIDGLKAGTYTFYFYVDGYETIKSANYTIQVLEPFTVEEYKENLIGQTYSYSTGMSTYEITFASENDLVLKMPTYLSDTSSDEGISMVEEHIDYTILEGKVLINADGDDKVNQIFDSTNGYFESAYACPLEISDDFNSVGLRLRIRSNAEGDIANYSYNLYTFTKKTDFSGLSGKTINTEVFIVGHGMSVATLNFVDKTSGKLEIITKGNEFIGGFTFNYSYDPNNDAFSISNVTNLANCVEGFSYKDAYLTNSNTLRISLVIPTPYNSGQIVYIDFNFAQ